MVGSNKLEESKNKIWNWLSNKMPLRVWFLFVVGIMLFAGLCTASWSIFGMPPYRLGSIALGKVTGYVQNKDNQDNQDNQIEPQVLGENVAPINCDFSETQKWIGTDGFFISNNTFIPSITENFSEGREMFCNEKMGTNFIATLKFTPLNRNKINVSINYGYAWRIIIGNGDYNQIQVQINKKYSEQNLRGSDWNIQGKDWIMRGGVGFKKENQIEARITTSSSKDNPRKININVIVRGTPADLRGKEENSFNFEVELPKDAADFNENIGVGIIDSKQEGIQVEFDNPLWIQWVGI